VRGGLAACAGILLGNTVHASLAALGITALIAAAPQLFDALRWLGALYLAYIAVRMLMSARVLWRSAEAGEAPPAPATLRRLFMVGLATNITNVKVILFYVAFVPQFIAPDLGGIAIQTLILGLTLALLGNTWHMIIAFLATGAARRFLGAPKVRAVIDGLAGTIFLGFAARLFLTVR